jgi:hypothetical protein
MRVWIIERDHVPLDVVCAFRDDKEGTAAMKEFLNNFDTSQEHHYYDAVLYERIEPGPKEG